ncbi:MAG TPA: CDP-alcohol phosphatidyltransferase family protein [Streptosporangiaceae bacterium]|nr:CDP-alcohol phosphatidyltransferase family protein [Streptosporangiaceae bacterium]
MNTSAHAAAGGLYSFKPWYARRLAPVRRRLVAANVPPAAITIAGILFGGGAGAALATLRPGPAAGVAVAALLAARLACANLDGGVARDGGRVTPFGSVLNEIGDRAAELAALAGCLALAPASLVLTAALAATLPSWVALAGAAAGLGRVQGGPVGKTERCLLLALLAVFGWPAVWLPVLAAGSALTAVVRAARLARTSRIARGSR